MEPGVPAGDPTAGETAACGPASGDPPAGWNPLLLLKALQAQWPTKALQQLREEAWRGFAALDDPLTGLLDMLESGLPSKGQGHSLLAWLACELQRWLQAQPRYPGPAPGSPQLEQLQARLAGLLTGSPLSLTEPLVSIFRLQDADRGLLLGHIDRLHNRGKFKEAILLSMKLKLQSELDIEKMSTPLLLQHRVNLLERYVDGFPDLQQGLLSLMDSWCQPGFDLRQVASRFPQMTAARLENLSPKLLSRQVLRLVQQYGMDPALFPNVINQQYLGTLQFLCYKRFVEGSLSQENWADHVQGLVGQNEWLQDQLLQLLTSHGDAAMAARCVRDLSLPEGRLPASVAAELTTLRLQERMALAGGRPEEPSSRDGSSYYRLPVTREHIHFLATCEDLTRHRPQLLQPGGVVGVDLEWRPLFQAAARPCASLVQLAVEGCVLLLDVPGLAQPPGGQGAQALSQFLGQLLSDPSITKLGYGMSGDLRSLGTSCPTLANVGQQIRGALDLQWVHRQMREGATPSPGVDTAEAPRGLSLLVQQVLGKPLDKAQQLSNWDLRPLREEQLVYAATDAYCLLDVYKVLCGDPARFHLSENLAKSLGARCSMRSGAQGPRQQPGCQEEARRLISEGWAVLQASALATEELAPEVSARNFRVVCDNMLQGLARSLRCLGVDVRVLGAGEDHRRAAEVARQEGRIILTSGLPYHKLRAQVGAGRCLSVDCALKAREQALNVLRHFNVRVTFADVFSRCQVCNCDQYLKVSKDMMRHLLRLGGYHEGPRSTGDEATPSEDGQGTGSAAELAPGNRVYDLPCRWLEASDLQSVTPATLHNGTRLQLAGVPAGVLWRPGQWPFYCCLGCGKIFWEGSHLGRLTAQFREILRAPPPGFCEPPGSAGQDSLPVPLSQPHPGPCNPEERQWTRRKRPGRWRPPAQLHPEALLWPWTGGTAEEDGRLAAGAGGLFSAAGRGPPAGLPWTLDRSSVLCAQLRRPAAVGSGRPSSRLCGNCLPQFLPPGVLPPRPLALLLMSTLSRPFHHQCGDNPGRGGGLSRTGWTGAGKTEIELFPGGMNGLVTRKPGGPQGQQHGPLESAGSGTRAAGRRRPLPMECESRRVALALPPAAERSFLPATTEEL
ncbi:exonuclease mut-7 homolog [Orycteropus afer afer]|uniref:Exonuclease mut-7 homolog n=1 Tax=Orycteropus afer afer TaxID=1230840 RepID=A0A8B7ABB5_ORYAF|nr:exonuclease mut-7 homolog [Orycteropus afer afer]